MSFASETIEKEIWENIDNLSPGKLTEHCHQNNVFEIEDIIELVLVIIKERIIFTHHYQGLNKD